MQLYRRERYLSRMRGFYHDEGLIKVVTGVRRSGKSCLMRTVALELEEAGVESSRIVFIDLDSLEHRKVRDADALEALVRRLAPPSPTSSANGPASMGSGPSESAPTTYLFIDEIQNVTGFEEVVNALRGDGGFSIFITGSNSWLLSGELATKLTGRYIAFELFTLDFAEYLDMKRMLGKPIDGNVDAEFASYLQEGGFPKAVSYDTLADKRAYSRAVVEEVFERDVRRNRIVRHLSTFDAVRDHLVGNFGATTSVTALLANLEREAGVRLKRDTLDRYIQILVDAKILYRVKRFDTKSRRALRGEQKYYLADLSFFHALGTDDRTNWGPALENVVHNYARSLGYSASVGRIGDLECDFVLRDEALDYSYVQVARTIASADTAEREFRSLERIRDAWPKYVLTMDRPTAGRNGVRHLNLVDFLAGETRF